MQNEKFKMKVRPSAASYIPSALFPMTLSEYFSKMRGTTKSPPGVGAGELLWSWTGSVIGIGICGYLSSRYFEPRDLTLLIGSFGASAVLVYGAIKSPLAQPRNLIGGHVLSGLVGVASHQFFGDTVWIAAALAVSLAIVLMLATKTLHPPGGATALIAVIGGQKIHNLGFLYAFAPAGLGALVLLIVALVINNLSPNRKYPEYWM
jgi:CBS-domain-containing membrane protein